MGNISPPTNALYTKSSIFYQFNLLYYIIEEGQKIIIIIIRKSPRLNVKVARIACFLVKLTVCQ